jgi:hypothetical protein
MLKRRSAMKALKNKKQTKTRTVSNKKLSFKKTTIQNQLESQFTGQYKNGSFNLSFTDVYYQLFGDLIID